MSKCIICGKEVDKTYGHSKLIGVYCKNCAIENRFTNEQLIEDLQSQLADITKKYNAVKQARELEISFKRADIYSRDNTIVKLEQQLAEKEKEQNQKAIEQLEKVKEKALHFLVQNQDKLSGFYVDVDEIDQQINELKGEK